MKLNDFIKILNEQYGSKTYIKLYLKQYHGALPLDAKVIWYGKLNTLKKNYSQFLDRNFEIKWISNSSSGMATTMNIFIKEAA